jgi:sortase A
MVLGVGLLGWVAWPIVSFSLFSAPLLRSVVTPLQQVSIGEDRNSDTVTRPVYAQDTVATGSQADYTNANMWFPTKPQKKVVSPVNSYTLSIPKLNIKDALVLIAGDDLDKSLIHYGGTGLPGDYGNGVIFGHSVLPQFFNPENYLTIFSTLPTIEEGDDIFIKYDGVTYRYQVKNLTVRDPSDLTALEQQYDDSYITLITCVPPGTYWKRLNVRARLISI